MNAAIKYPTDINVKRKIKVLKIYKQASTNYFKKEVLIIS